MEYMSGKWDGLESLYVRLSLDGLDITRDTYSWGCTLAAVAPNDVVQTSPLCSQNAGNSVATSCVKLDTIEGAQ